MRASVAEKFKSYLKSTRRVAVGALAILAVSSLSGCGLFDFLFQEPEPEPEPEPHEVTLIEIHKSERRMFLFDGEEPISEHKISLGFAPEGHKEKEGDGKTPVGEYVIDRRNPQSLFFLSLGISYPREEDIKRAEELGEKPGGDIFIHGQPNYIHGLPNNSKFKIAGDWTQGCVAVSNAEMLKIYNSVEIGTPVHIFP